MTVAAVVAKDGRYLIVEERAMGSVVLNQPGGHIESGETPEQAVVREVLEETGCTVVCGDLIGVYLWIQPQTRQQFLRIIYSAEYVSRDESLSLDKSTVAVRWISATDLEHRRRAARTPVVLRAVRDYEAGQRKSHELLSGMLPLQHNVLAVMASADLV
ncbi:MAG: NUDIX domain-containing protein [Gammaproteobacteria bacterium]|nr:NUDIX domain-containing protein [Gammaproteobacteria bacterium]